MNTFSTWSPPVAVSLLFHVALIVLITHRLSVTESNKIPLQAISVEMLGATPATKNQPRLQKAAPAVTAKPAPEPVKVEQPPVARPSPEPAQADTATSEAANSLAPDSTQSSLNIQPLSKLTRPPALLRKIEPVYPLAEQRAGSQAYVLAEATIDDKGSVVEVKILKSAGNAFDTAVKEALKKSVFMPGYIGKEAVAVRVLVPFRFNLR